MHHIKILASVLFLSILVGIFIITISTAADSQNIKPNLIIEKKVVENLVQQNISFTVQVLFRNSGNAAALNINLKDNIPSTVAIVSGTTTWSGQLKPGDGDGLTYTAFATKKGYLDLGSAKATYKDSKNTTYSASSSVVEVYVEPSQPPTVFDFLDKYQKPLQIIGTVAGVVGSLYGIYEIFKRKFAKPQNKYPMN